MSASAVAMDEVAGTFGHAGAMTGAMAQAGSDPGAWLAGRRAVMDNNEASWLAVLADFDASEGWAADGQLSGATWLVCRCGMARSTAYEKLRLARELRRRDVVRKAFAAGEITYSAARAICGIDDAPEEVDQALVDLARSAPIDDVEAAVRHYEFLQEQERGGPSLWRPERREVRIFKGFYGLGQLRATLTNAELEAVEATLRAFGERATPEPSAAADSHGSGTGATDGPKASSAAADFGGPTDRVAEGAESRSAAADVAALTGRAPDGGESRSAAADSDGPGAAEPEEPGGRSAAADSQGSASAEVVEELTEVVEELTEEVDWRYSWGQARADALLDALTVALAHREEGHAAGAERYLVHVVADAAGLSGTREGRAELVDGSVLGAEEAARIACDASFVAHLVTGGTEPLYLGRRVREWSTAQRRAITVRDGGHCRFPGCRRRLTDIHHIQPWEEGGVTDVSNGALLCGRHHTLVHQGFVAEGNANDTLTFLRRSDRAVVGSTTPPRPKTALFG